MIKGYLFRKSVVFSKIWIAIWLATSRFRVGFKGFKSTTVKYTFVTNINGFTTEEYVKIVKISYKIG